MRFTFLFTFDSNLIQSENHEKRSCEASSGQRGLEGRDEKECKGHPELGVRVRTAQIQPSTSKIQQFVFFCARCLNEVRKNGKKKNENRKMKTPVYDGEGGKISPSCPI